MFREASHPRTFELLWGGADIGSTVVMYYKARDNRARPAQRDPSLFPVLETPGHPSYPSGHSTQAHLIAFTLAHLVPAATVELEAVAWQIAVNREIAGLHFRSDTVAGRDLAGQIFAILLDGCPGYRAALDEAAAEWR